MNMTDDPILVELLRAQIREHIGPIAPKFANLRAHAEERGCDPALIDRAESWLVTFRAECGETWREPENVYFNDVEHEIELRWYGATHTLSVDVGLNTVTYSAWTDDEAYSEDGAEPGAEKRAELWRWFNAERQVQG